MIDWQKIHTIISGAERILLTTHENPDGDGLGCAAALYHYLKRQSKDVRIINHSAFPEEFQFLNQKQIFETHRPDEHAIWMGDVQLVIIFDVGDYHRLKSIRTVIERYSLPTINMDHHPLMDGDQFTYDIVDVNAAATGVLLYDYFQAIGELPLTKEIAEGIYTAIMTDTGSFRYTNTNTKCHAIAIECFKAGIDHVRIYQQVYESSSRERMRLLGDVLRNLRYEEGGELAWFTVSRSMLEEAGASKKDVEGFTDFVRTIRGVEVALMVYENGHDSCRMNFRSKGKYVVNTIAQALGGGGHRFAAGAVIHEPIEKVLPLVLETTRSALRDQNGHAS